MNEQSHSLRQFTRAYCTKNTPLAWAHLLGTVVVFVAVLGLALASWGNVILTGFWMFAAGVVGVRLYMLQHEAGHGTLMDKTIMNTRVGVALSFLTHCPFHQLKYNHNLHHAHIGDLDERGSTEIYTMTVDEFRRANWWDRLRYRVYRNPIILFVIGPPILAFLLYRLPKNWRDSGPWSLAIHNIGLLVMYGTILLLFGWPGIFVVAGSVAIGACWGAVIPYVQHNFENVYWERNPDLDFATAALQGSAVIDFGRVYDFLTLNIAYHDIHHLNARIPFYNLRRCHLDMSELLQPEVIRVPEIWATLRCNLADEETGKMVPFPPLLWKLRGLDPRALRVDPRRPA